jgi:hypothetical protein
LLPRLLVAAALIAPASADAAITHSSVLAPADPHYRLYTPQNKEVENVDVSGMTDGVPGDAELKRNVAIDEDGRFATAVPVNAFGARECTLRALSIKFRPKELAAFIGPRVAVTFFAPEDELAPVSGRETPAVRDYLVKTGTTGVRGAGAGAVAREVWEVADVHRRRRDDRRRAAGERPDPAGPADGVEPELGRTPEVRRPERAARRHAQLRQAQAAQGELRREGRQAAVERAARPRDRPRDQGGQRPQAGHAHRRQGELRKTVATLDTRAAPGGFRA